MSTLDGFKGGKYHVLVATDVAARGLDIKSIKTVRGSLAMLWQGSFAKCQQYSHLPMAQPMHHPPLLTVTTLLLLLLLLLLLRPAGGLL